MLLFHKTDDVGSVQKYKDIVAKELYHEKGKFLLYHVFIFLCILPWTRKARKI